MKKHLLALALMVAVPLGVAACDGDDESDEDKVRDVIELVNKKDPDVCDKLTTEYKEARGVSSDAECKQKANETKANAVAVEKVSVNGDKATVTAELQGQPGELLLVKDGDDWKLNEVKVGR